MSEVASRLFLRFTVYYNFFLDLMGYAVVLPVFAPLIFSDTFHWFDEYSFNSRVFWFVALLFTYAFAHWLGSPFFASVADIKGKKAVLVVTTSMTVLGFVTAAFGLLHENLVLLLVGRFLGGFAAGNSSFFSNISQKLIQPVSSGFFKLRWPNLAGGLGLIAGPLLVGVIVDENLHELFFNALPFWVMAILSFLNLVLLISLPEEDIEDTKKVRLTPFRNFAAFFSFWKHPVRFNECTSVFFFFLGWFSFIQYTSVVLFMRYDFSESGLGFTFAILGVAWCIALFFAQRRISVTVLLFAAGLFSFASVSAQNIQLFVPLLALIIAISALLWTNIGSFFLEEEDPAVKETQILHIYISCALAAVLSTLICGPVLLLHYGFIYVITGTCFFVSGWLMLISRRSV